MCDTIHTSLLFSAARQPGGPAVPPVQVVPGLPGGLVPPWRRSKTHNQTMELLLWDSGFRFAPAGLVALVGLWLTFVGGWRQVRYLKLPTGTRGKNHGWVRAMRQMIQGMSLLAIGLGWAWQLPVMMVAGAVFGFEETIETSIATWALKQEADGRAGFA